MLHTGSTRDKADVIKKKIEGDDFRGNKFTDWGSYREDFLLEQAAAKPYGWLVCAEASGVKAIIGLNKVDLVEAAATANALALYRDLGYEVIPFSAKFNHGPMRERLAGERSVLIGQSGMGKSKLLNALVGSGKATTSA